MATAQGRFLVRVGEQLAAIVADRFEQSVAGGTRAGLAIHDRLRDEAIEDLEHLLSRHWLARGDRDRRVEIEAAREHRDPPPQHALLFREQSEAPVKRCSQRAVATIADGVASREKL